MRRRDFIKVVAVSTALCPFAARARQPAMPVVGFLSGQSPTHLGTLCRHSIKA